jgi:hypothetical protein
MVQLDLSLGPPTNCEKVFFFAPRGIIYSLSHFQTKGQYHQPSTRSLRARAIFTKLFYANS